MPKSSFSITVNLKAFFANHKAKAKLFINEGIKTISDLEEKISEIFCIQKFHLVSHESLLPSCEDIRVLHSGDSICAVPNDDRNELLLLDESFYKNSETTKPKKKKKRKIVEDECPVKEKKQKKKKREFISPLIDEPEINIENETKTPEKCTRDIVTIKKEKNKIKDKYVSWSTSPLKKTTNHVKINKIPAEQMEIDYSKFSFKPLDCVIVPTPDLVSIGQNSCTSSCSIDEIAVEKRESSNEFLITKEENPSFSQNSNVVGTTQNSDSKKETELRNWKQSILEKFTHNLQTQKIEDNQPDASFGKNEITSTNRDFSNDSPTNSVVSKITKMNPTSLKIKKNHNSRQATGVSYYFKLMNKIGWDTSKSISSIDLTESTPEDKNKKEPTKETEEVEESDYSGSDFITKRKRKRKHKKRPRIATPMPRNLTPMSVYVENSRNPSVESTPKHHIRFGEIIQDTSSGPPTPMCMEENVIFDEKSQENVRILQNFSLVPETMNISSCTTLTNREIMNGTDLNELMKHQNNNCVSQKFALDYTNQNLSVNENSCENA